ncbi:hypothetical protein [Pseudoalteromonas sp. G4]|uniref:hypothetical protein n=1 Tax=Pseudoalteromonas sp. G4 TaxID=2992761 RepID=UPI00237ED6FA|nr:hypothetical protein [Pseudoalteromonas sp. G4]MDE3272838.1 hypothetical protein [Pseudoalteromonas sp. G4]
MNAFIPLIYGLFLFGSLSCYSLHAFFNIPIVLAATMPALIGSFIPFNKQHKHHPYAAIYTGCFAGMCSVATVSALWEFIFIAAIGTLLYIKSINLFEGFGGRLGGIAFTCSALFVLLKGMLWV